jgi:hypothetical protein
LFEADTLENGIDSKAISQLANSPDRLLASLAPDVGRSELSGECDSVGMTSEDDDLLGAQPLGGDHSAKTHRTVSHDRHRLPNRDIRGDRHGGPSPSRLPE